MKNILVLLGTGVLALAAFERAGFAKGQMLCAVPTASGTVEGLVQVGVLPGLAATEAARLPTFRPGTGLLN